MESIALTQPFRQRLSQDVEHRYEITNYDKDNLYPQKVQEIVSQSPIANRASLALADFLRGDGWELNRTKVINSEGETIQDLLRQITADKSVFNGYSIHINVNIIGQITSMKYIPFEYVRLGLPTPSGKHYDVKVNSNWEKDVMKGTARGHEKTWTFPLWGEWDMYAPYGYVFYATPRQDNYPKAVADPVLDSCQADAETQLFELGNIQNGFLGTSIFRYPGSTEESPDERTQMIDMLRQLKGSAGANGIGYVELNPAFTGPLIENIPANNNDSLFINTTANILQRILLNYGMPKIILGIEPQSGMFNKDEIENQYYYYNVRTRDIRNSIEEDINSLTKHFIGGGFQVGRIIENKFATETVVETVNTNQNG